MRAVDCLASARTSDHYQLFINELIDAFRRAKIDERAMLVHDPIETVGPLEGLVAGVVSALCREHDLTAPPWVALVNSPTPFFPFPARTFALRLRLMIESPPPFRCRNVFVPDNYMARA